ncbi:class I SAM-dependent methyltransferase [Maribacter algarum]|uniref:Class I SAM-dependent methyltransferase n=1 Tax=Maribacter algarum (ex Zhang et al. 2020) TaxID=2578118 RepID=A0A5S3PDX0_9FLAO|nr:class I SAM-dependent methyltransferase [Maribacter algarum]TMM52172.1 class I SAM-dependent methyltransferase [Maribacter algarum]
MDYWERRKASIEHELDDLSIHLKDWRVELSIANTPDKKKLCKRKIKDLEDELEKYENELNRIIKKIYQAKVNYSKKEDFQPNEISTDMIFDLLKEKSKTQNQERIENEKKINTPYMYGKVVNRDLRDNEGSQYTIKGEDENTYYCNYSHILTEGFRTLEIGDKIRFVSDLKSDKNLATYVVKIEKDLIFIEDYPPELTRKTKKHYDSISDNYDELWTYSKDFVTEITKNIISLLEIKETDVIVDFGCGTGIYSKAIRQQVSLKKPIICTDISEKMLSKINDGPSYTLFHKGAIQFSELKLQYDKVFIKEMIHHVKRGRQRLYDNIYNNLNKSGIFIILLLPPKIEYPLFTEAIKYYEENQPHYSEIEKGMKTSGFLTEVSFVEYPLEIEKGKYFAMVRNRYMSLLSEFTDSEIENGINEMESKYKNENILKFNDIFVVVKGRKTNNE